MLAITGGKGGSGKTTTALGLARALARAGADPLVVDGDTDCPDVHLLAGVDRHPTGEALDEDAILECVCQRAPSLGGIAVLPAGSGDRLERTLRRAATWHGPVLVDCPAGAGPGATLPLRHADGTVLACLDDPETLSDAAKAARMARRLDAPPVAALVRVQRRVAELPFACPRVERVPPVDIERTADRAVETVLSHPGVRAAHRRVATALEWRPMRGADAGGSMRSESCSR